MRTITNSELVTILSDHKLWLQSGGTEGARAYLVGAYLADAYLADANLAGANLAGANLAGADLADADLADANLADARNVPEMIFESTEPSAPQSHQTHEEWVSSRPQRESTRAQRYAERARRYRASHPDVPVVDQLDAKILAGIEAKTLLLEMGSWHGGATDADGEACGTTHCRAGSAIHLAGQAGYSLEEKYGPENAGRMIYLASTGRVPHFYETNERALEDIRRCAAEQTATP